MASSSAPYLKLLCFAVLLLLFGVVGAQEDQTCSEGDESCSSNNSSSESNDCVDTHEECAFWAGLGECKENPSYMLTACRKACNSCSKVVANEEEGGGEEDEYGVIQELGTKQAHEVEQAIADMRDYMKKAWSDPDTTPKMREILKNCKLKHKACAFWKVLGECEANPKYMKGECAPVCHTCDYLSIETRCPIDPEAPMAWGPGDLNKFFLNITTLPEFQKFEPNVISRPDYVNGDTEETADYQLGPWVVTLDNFVSQEEAARLIELGANEGYERSADVGKMKFDGTFETSVNNGRTSTNAWCQHECYNDTMAQQVIAKINDITKIPENNSEYLQLLRYEVGQHYQTHHDYIDFQVDRQPGVRIITIFLYLNDVEAGGGTNFPELDITVQPKTGRALIWPSVIDEDPNQVDGRTMHQALPVEAGLKYGANAWIHQRDFKTPNNEGC